MTASKPKLFISYSWSSPEHEERVLALATELCESGVDVILDKWNLREGQDAYAFMESMVTAKDVNKVLLVCDRVYVQKADHRKGGVGAEAQILTPELYSRQDQTKFVALVLEHDEEGRPVVPAFYKARLHIDYSDNARQSDAFERLLRWVHDRPLHVKPPIGERPAFLDEVADGPTTRTAVQLRRAITAIKEERRNAAASLAEYLAAFVQGFESLRLSRGTQSVWDDAVVESIESFRQRRNEFVGLLNDVAVYRPGSESVTVICRFFEKLMRYNYRPEGVGSWQERDFDNYRFLTHELFLYCVAVFLKNERFEDAAQVLASEYYCSHLTEYRKLEILPFTAFYDPPGSLEERNTRLQLHRVSLHADLLKQRCVDLPVSFSGLMQADFVLFLRSNAVPNGHRTWWPVTLVYTGHFPSRFELFARARSLSYFETLKPVLGVESIEQFKGLVNEFTGGKRHGPRWDFEYVDIAALCGLNELGIRE